MNISKYTSFFHDGSIFNIFHVKDRMIIDMESAQIDATDLTEPILRLEGDRIKGKLHIEGIKKIKENDVLCESKIKMKCADAEILHFHMSQNRVFFQIAWSSYPPTVHIQHFSKIEIEAAIICLLLLARSRMHKNSEWDSLKKIFTKKRSSDLITIL